MVARHGPIPYTRTCYGNLDAAIARIPVKPRRGLLVTIDGAGT
jgi:hypothetical protein